MLVAISAHRWVELVDGSVDCVSLVGRCWCSSRVSRARMVNAMSPPRRALWPRCVGASPEPPLSGATAPTMIPKRNTGGQPKVIAGHA